MLCFGLFSKVKIMKYNDKLASRIRAHLAEIPGLEVEEKDMFRCHSFMVNGRMCIGVSGDEMMVRFDPALQDDFAGKKGFRPMETKNRIYKGHGYIDATAISSDKDFAFWVKHCLEFNPRAKSGRKLRK